jgi:hypothetical protein
MVSQETDHALLAPELYIAKIWEERRRYICEGRVEGKDWEIAKQPTSHCCIFIVVSAGFCSGQLFY